MINLGVQPSADFVEFKIESPPVSQQASSESKKALRHAIRRVLGTAQYLLTGDIRVEVKWSISEQVRYETDRAPDVDNILKPLLDSLVGPNGIIIDDNQVQHVSCSWTDWKREGEELTVALHFISDEWLPKKGLIFVQFDRGICLPIPASASEDQCLDLLEAYKSLLLSRADADSQGLPYTWAKVIMPKQRVFHRTRLGQFLVESEEKFRARFTNEP